MCSLADKDCSGPLQRDHIGYHSVTHQDVFQWLYRYHNRSETRGLWFFVANQVLGGRPLPGQVRIRLNEWHIRFHLHPEFKKRIYILSEENPFPEKFIPGWGQQAVDKAVSEDRIRMFRWKPGLCEGRLIGFWVQLEGERLKQVR